MAQGVGPTVASKPTASVAVAQRPDFYWRHGKRLLDLALAIPLLVLTAPIVVLLSLATVLVSGWPPLYAARRVGEGGREFSVLKIRTMVNGADKEIARWHQTAPELAAEYEENFKLRNDPRVTFLGRLLRRSSLDELPQLWNVVRGDMSLVGPRPYYAHELQGPAGQHPISRVKPGLTGPWQVRGRNDLPPQERIRLDVIYTEEVTLSRDLSYLARTMGAIVRMDGI